MFEVLVSETGVRWAGWVQAAATFAAVAVSLWVSVRSIRAQRRLEDDRLHQDRLENVCRATVFLSAGIGNIQALRNAAERENGSPPAGAIRFTLSALDGDHAALQETLLEKLPGVGVLGQIKQATMDLHGYIRWLDRFAGEVPPEFPKVTHQTVSRLEVSVAALSDFIERYTHDPSAQFVPEKEDEWQKAKRISDY